MRGTDVGRSKHTPFRIEPARGKRTQDDVEAVLCRDERSDVFNNDKSRLNLGDDSSEFVPESAACSAAHAFAFSGERDVGARKTALDAIHASTKASTVEGRNVRPNKTGSQAAFFHARDQNLSGVSFPLHVNERAKREAKLSEGVVDSEIESAAA